MAVNFTKTYLDDLELPASGQAFLWDSGQGGLGIRLTPNSKTFVFQQRVHGKTARKAIGKWPDWTIDKARKAARTMAVLVDEGVNPVHEAKRVKAAERAAKANMVTLGQCADRYLSDRELSDRSRKDYSDYMRRHFSDWLDMPLVSITGDMVCDRYKEVAARNGASQASSGMRVLRAFFTYGKAVWKGVVHENPVDALKERKLWLKDQPKTDRLHPNEIGPWLREVRKWPKQVMRLYIEFILLTGCRRGEAAALRWADINDKQQVLLFRDTKNGSDRELPICPRVRAILDELLPMKPPGPEKGSTEPLVPDYIFPSKDKHGQVAPTNAPTKALDAINKATGCSTTAHGLRRTAARELERLDCPSTPLKGILGHAMRDVTTRHYVQVDAERMRPWLCKYESYILSLLDGVISEDDSDTGTSEVIDGDMV